MLEGADLRKLLLFALREITLPTKEALSLIGGKNCDKSNTITWYRISIELTHFMQQLFYRTFNVILDNSQETTKNSIQIEK